MASSQFLRPSKCALTFHSLRNVLALGLAALLFFASQGVTVTAQQPAPVPIEVEGDYFVTHQDVKGHTICRGATAAEKHELKKVRTENLGLRPILRDKRQYDFQADGGAAAAADAEPQKIILRGTPQLDNYPEAKAAFVRAAQIWEQQIKSTIVIYIDVDFGSTYFGGAWGNPYALGATSSPRWWAYYPSLRTHLIEKASTPEEVSLYNSLSPSYVPTNTINRDMVYVAGPVLRALGFGLSQVADPAEPAPRIGFNSYYQFDYDPSDGIDSDKFDFEAVAAHEIGHALGFISTAGADSDPAVWDLFRFRAGTTLETFGTAQRIMTADGLQYYFSGGEDLPLSTGGPNGQAPGGDGNQSSHWKESWYLGGKVVGIMDARLPYGTRRQISYNDANALNFFGYDVDMSKAPPPPPPPPPPPANDKFADAEVLEGCGGSVNGTNISATRELDEPYHGAGSGASAWYQWQALSTGEVTVSTTGSRTNYDSVLAVYSGDSLNTLQQISRNDGYGNYSELKFYATAGTTYRFAVDGYAAAEGDFVLNWKEFGCVPKANQSITFTTPSDKTYGDAPFTVSASASSGLPVSLSILSGPATVSGNTVAVNGAGTVAIRASQSGDASYNAAPNVEHSFTVNKAPATITLGNLNQTYNGAAKSATTATNPAGLSGVVLSYSQNGATVAAPTSAGSYTVTASLSNSNYQASDATGTLVISKAGQTINFGTLSNKTYGNAAFNLNATASSGLPVSFKVISGPATISGSTITLTGAGTVIVRASQAGGANYNPAANVDRSFVVNKAQATLTLGSLNHIYNGAVKRATVVTNPAGLGIVTISYSRSGAPVSAPVNAGSYTVRASLNNAKYQATALMGTLVIAKASQTISFGTLATRTYGSGAFNIAASASSRLPVIFRIVSGPAVISGSTITTTGVGTVVVRATQAGDANYSAAAPVDRTFTVTKAAQTITFDALPSKTYGDAPFMLSAISSAGLPVSLQVVSGPATLYANKLTLTGVGKVTVQATQAGNNNYSAAVAVTRTFDVTSANPNIALSGLAFTYDGTVKSATVVTKPAGLNVTVSYTQNGVSVTPLKAGTYSVSATINDANYRGAVTGTLVINKAKPVITWGDPSAIVFGTALGGAQLNAQANVPGVFKYSPAAGIVLGVGRYQLSVSFTPSDAANYTTATKNVTLTVNAQTAQALGYDMTNYIAEVASNTIRWTAFFERLAEERNIFPPPSPFTDCCPSG